MPPARALPLPCFFRRAIGPIESEVCGPEPAASFSKRLRRFCRASSSSAATELVEATGLLEAIAALRCALGMAFGLQIPLLSALQVHAAWKTDFLRLAEVLFKLESN